MARGTQRHISWSDAANLEGLFHCTFGLNLEKNTYNGYVQLDTAAIPETRQVLFSYVLG